MTNVAVIVGNLTRDPEMRYTAQGKAVTEFTVAVNEGFGDKKSVVFIRCQAWDKLAETIADMARKGTRVVVEGRISIDQWNDKQNNKREVMRIIARNCSIMSGTPRKEKSPEEVDLSDMPF